MSETMPETKPKTVMGGPGGRRNLIAIEAARLANFLGNNQLVQANAIITKVEAILQEMLAPAGQDAEKSALWEAFKLVLRVKSLILSGRTEEALKDARELTRKV